MWENLLFRESEILPQRSVLFKYCESSVGGNFEKILWLFSGFGTSLLVLPH